MSSNWTEELEDIIWGELKLLLSARKGRHFKDFTKFGNQNKRQKVAPLFENSIHCKSWPLLPVKAFKPMVDEKFYAAKIEQEILDYSPTRATRAKKTF